MLAGLNLRFFLLSSLYSLRPVVTLSKNSSIKLYL